MTDKLVTLIGGGGFLGRYMAQALLRSGARVRIAQRDPRAAWFLKTQAGLGQIQFVAADILRRDTIERAVAGSAAVINLVGTFGARMRDVHVDGARCVAAAAAAAGAGAMVHVSALGADPDSRSSYGFTKAQGEAAVTAAFPGATILRPSTVFGREDQFINRFAGMIASLPVIPVLRGSARFQPVWVSDVADAAVAALGDPAAHAGRTYSLGGPDVMSMAEINRWIAREIGRNPAFLDVPDVMGAGLALFGFLPGAPITWDQWLMLKGDSIVPEGAPGLAALGVLPTPLAAVAPQWLVRFRRHGRFGAFGPQGTPNGAD